MSALSTIAAARPPLTARLGGSPAQIAILIGVALFLIAFLIVPILRVILVAFTAPEGGFTLIHFGDFLDNALLRESFWNSIYVAAMTVVVASAGSELSEAAYPGFLAPVDPQGRDRGRGGFRRRLGPAQLARRRACGRSRAHPDRAGRARHARA